MSTDFGLGIFIGMGIMLGAMWLCIIINWFVQLRKDINKLQKKKVRS